MKCAASSSSSPFSCCCCCCCCCCCSHRFPAGFLAAIHVLRASSK
jgi:hypothetical protein